MGYLFHSPTGTGLRADVSALFGRLRRARIAAEPASAATAGDPPGGGTGPPAATDSRALDRLALGSDRRQTADNYDDDDHCGRRRGVDDDSERPRPGLLGLRYDTTYEMLF